MIAQIVPSPDAEIDPWCLVPLLTGGQVLFGYARIHAGTGGLSWLRSTPVVDLDEAACRARTMSGRTYRLGRQFEPAAISGEGEEAAVAFEILIGRDAAGCLLARAIDTAGRRAPPRGRAGSGWKLLPGSVGRLRGGGGLRVSM